MVLSWGKALQRRILNLLVDKTVFLTLAGLLTLMLISIAWLGEKWIVVSKRIEMLIFSKKKSITIYHQDTTTDYNPIIVIWFIDQMDSRQVQRYIQFVFWQFSWSFYARFTLSTCSHRCGLHLGERKWSFIFR